MELLRISMHPSTALSFRAVVSVSSPTASPPDAASVLTVTSFRTCCGRLTAIRSPEVRGIISLEPGTYVFPEGEVPEDMPSLTGTMKGIAVPPEEFNKLTQIPIILYFGDYIPENVTDKLGGENWRVRLQMGRKFVEAVNRHGGHAALVELPKIGIRGNTHFLMSDKNNNIIADHMAAWLRQNKLDR